MPNLYVIHSFELNMHNIISLESFPTLPNAIRKVQNISVVNNLNSKTLIDILETDPLLCVNILKLVNSPYYGLKHKVSSINHAVLLLGTTVIRGIIMAAVLKKSFPLDISPYQITINEFDKICSLRVRFLNELFKGRQKNIDNLSSVSFLMEAGKIITSHTILNNKLEDEFRKLQQELTIEESERKLFGQNSYDTAGRLFKTWGFEEDFTDLIANFLNTETADAQTILMLHTLINTQGIFNNENIQKALEFAETYKMNVDKIKEIIAELQKEIS